MKNNAFSNVFNVFPSRTPEVSNYQPSVVSKWKRAGKVIFEWNRKLTEEAGSDTLFWDFGTSTPCAELGFASRSLWWGRHTF